MSLSNPALPADIIADPDAVEIVRAWISRGQAVITVRPAFNDPVALGQLLAAIAQQAAAAYADRVGVAEAAALDGIVKGFSSPAGAGAVGEGERQ